MCKKRQDQKLYFKFCKKKKPLECNIVSNISVHLSKKVTLGTLVDLPENRFFILTIMLNYGNFRRVSGSVKISEYDKLMTVSRFKQPALVTELLF